MTTQPKPVIEKDKKQIIPLSKLPRTLVGRRWWIATLLVIAGVLVMARLGIWQLDRLDQRRAANAAYLEQINAPPLPLDGTALTADPAELVDRQATVAGQYDISNQIILVTQSYQGRPGAHIVTPLLIENTDVAVLVDRGWIPAKVVETADFDQYDPQGPQLVRGVIQLSQTLDRGRETVLQGPQQEWYRIDILAIQQQLPYQLLPFYLLQSPDTEYQEELPYKQALEVDLSEGPHLGYAIQWFLFSTILAIGYLYFVRTHTPGAKTE